MSTPYWPPQFTFDVPAPDKPETDKPETTKASTQSTPDKTKTTKASTKTVQVKSKITKASTKSIPDKAKTKMPPTQPAPDKPKTSTHSCVKCHKEATKSCKACRGAPSVAPDGKRGTVETRWYCGEQCQKLDWKEHKPACTAAQTRQLLYRAGDVLQETLFMYKETFYEKSIVRADRMNGDIIVTEDWYSAEDLFFSFPSSMFPKKEEREAVLLHRACDDAPAYLYKMILMMLRGTCNEMLEIVVTPRDRQIKIRCRAADGTVEHNLERDHRAIKVDYKNGESYVLDLTGRQFGHFDTVLPFDHYETAKATMIREIHPFGVARLQINLRSYEQTYKGRLVRTNAIAAMYLEHAMKGWVLENVSLEAMLKQPETSFQKSRSELLGTLKIALESFKEGITKGDGWFKHFAHWKMMADDAHEAYAHLLTETKDYFADLGGYLAIPEETETMAHSIDKRPMCKSCVRALLESGRSGKQENCPCLERLLQRTSQG